MLFKPRQYQQHAIDWILARDASALFLGLGMGKTVSTLTAIDITFDRCEIARWLVVGPKRVVEHTWPSEIAKWDHLQHLKPTILTAKDIPLISTAKNTTSTAQPDTSTAKRTSKPSKAELTSMRNALVAEGNVFFCHYDLIPRLVMLYGDHWPFDGLVLDESSMVKNPDTKRFKALKRIRTHVSKIVELTGTPCPNGIEQLYSQVHLLDGGQRLGRTLTAFRDSFMRPGARRGAQVFEYVPKTGAREQVYELISDLAMSMKVEDWLEMPERIVNVIEVELPAKVLKSYQDIERDMLMDVQGDVVEAVTAAALINKLLQIANGTVYGDDKKVIEMHDAKIEALKSLIDETETPILLAYTYKHDLQRLQAAFPKSVTLGIKTDRYASDSAIIEAWNQGKIELLLTHPMSAGHGLNLQYGSAIACWYSLTYDLELYQQWNGRLYRSGQTADRVVIHHLVAKGTIDEDVLDILEGKNQEQNALLYAVDHRKTLYS